MKKKFKKWKKIKKFDSPSPLTLARFLEAQRAQAPPLALLLHLHLITDLAHQHLAMQILYIKWTQETIIELPTIVQWIWLIVCTI